ncbi:MAG: multicopper oxidase domain-containing protein [Methylocystis sp.]
MALIAVCVSGVAWFILHDLVEEEPSNFQRMSLVTHGVSAYAALVIFGSVLPLHVRSSWSGKRNVATGIVLILVIALLIVTALFLYYGGEETRWSARWVHLGVGVTAALAFPLHVVLGRRSRKKAYRNNKNVLTATPPRQTATLRTAGIDTGPGGDSWPAINLAHVSFPEGIPSKDLEAIHVGQRTDIFEAPVAGAKPAPLPDGCRALPQGHRRRMYFGNPNIAGGAGPGEDAAGNAIFGIGYEEIDQNGNPVIGTFVDVTRFDPGQAICLPLAPGQQPAIETWKLVNLTTELHNFQIHQTKFRVIPQAHASGREAFAGPGPSIAEDTVPLPFAVPGPGSQPAQNANATSCLVSDFKAGRCQTTPILVQIPFAKLGAFVFHCHILEHEDGGMMHAIRIVPSPM